MTSIPDTSCVADRHPAENAALNLKCGVTARLLAAWHNRRRRQRLRRLADLDPKILDDIGVTREEVTWALSLPLSVNAAVELHARAAARRRRQVPWRGGRGSCSGGETQPS